MANGFFGGGDGTVTSPYLIEDVYDLQAVSNNPSSNFLVVNSFDCSGFDFTPISSFSGNFNGGMHEISGLTINKTTVSSTGLFRYISSGAIVKNIKLTNATINGADKVGGIVGSTTDNQSTAKIQNCSFSGSITGTSDVGGIIGSGYFSVSSGVPISNCHTHGSVNGTSNIGGIIGNLVVYSSSGTSLNIENCYSSCYVSGTSNIGGVIGYFGGNKVKSCFYLGNRIIRLSGTNTYFGDIYGRSGATVGLVENCYSLDTLQFVQE